MSANRIAPRKIEALPRLFKPLLIITASIKSNIINDINHTVYSEEQYFYAFVFTLFKTKTKSYDELLRRLYSFFCPA